MHDDFGRFLQVKLILELNYELLVESGPLRPNPTHLLDLVQPLDIAIHGKRHNGRRQPLPRRRHSVGRHRVRHNQQRRDNEKVKAGRIHINEQ